MRQVWVGMTRLGLLDLAAKIHTACAEHPDDEGIEVEIHAEHNWSHGPGLVIRLSNDDMEGDHVSHPSNAYWEEGP